MNCRNIMAYCDLWYGFLSLILLATTSCQGSDWGYNEANGPNTWPSTYPECGGQSQSPINIQETVEQEPPDINWINYKKTPQSMTMRNNGHTVKIDAVYGSSDDSPQLEFKYTKSNYSIGIGFKLDSVHFHWGKDDSDGSEHALEGKKFPLELHSVHKSDQGNILVVAVFFQLSSEKNVALIPVTSRLSEVETPATTVNDVTPFSWSSVITAFTSDFYSYTGSLTTPPCTEGVTWILSKKISIVDHAQMEGFRQLRNAQGESLAPNFRPAQALNDRQVFDY